MNNYLQAFIKIVIVLGIIIISVTLMSSQREKQLKGMGFNTTSMNPIQQREIRINQPLTQAIESCREALQTIPKLSILSVDTANMIISAKVGMTWHSWGESVTVGLAPEGGGTSAYIRSVPRLRFTIVDYGKGVENVETFVRRLAAVNPKEPQQLWHSRYFK